MALQEADYGMTELAMSGNLGRYKGDEVLLVRFFIHPRMNRTLSATMERPIYEDAEYIQIMQPGNKESIVIRPAMATDKTRFVEHYRKFKAREEQQDSDGTLLAEWPQITRSQVEELRFFNVRTVEQLINVSDVNAQNIMGFGALQTKAIEFLDKAATTKSAVELQAKLDEKQEQIDSLMARMEAMEADDTPLEATPELSGVGEGTGPSTEESPADEPADKKSTRRRRGKKAA